MRHHAHLATLIASLRGAGFREDMVETSIRTLVDSYAEGFMAAIRSILKGDLYG